jgi:hypothetical protein
MILDIVENRGQMKLMQHQPQLQSHSFIWAEGEPSALALAKIYIKF